MKKLKVLPHSTYKLRENPNGLLAKRNERIIHELKNYHTEINPVFNRDGEYLQGNKCWIEVNGKAYLSDRETFLYQIQFINDSEKGIEVYRLLKSLQRVNENILSEEQKRFLCGYKQVLSLKDLKRDSIKRRLKLKLEQNK